VIPPKYRHQEKLLISIGITCKHRWRHLGREKKLAPFSPCRNKLECLSRQSLLLESRQGWSRTRL